MSQMTHEQLPENWSDQQKADYLFNQQQAAEARAKRQAEEPQQPASFTASPIFQNMEQRMRAAMEKAQSQPPVPKPLTFEERLTPFERDCLIIRHILGGKSIYDGASYHNPNVPQGQVMQWLKESFKPSGSNFALIMGRPGSAKTWAVLAYAASIAEVEFGAMDVKSVNVRFVTAYKLADWVHACKTHEKELEQLARVPILIVDDMGTEPTGYRGGDFHAHFVDLFNTRYTYNRITLMTSNLNAAQFKETYGERVVSRFNQFGLAFETTDPDFRQGGKA